MCPFQFRSEVIKELQAELDAEMAATQGSGGDLVGATGSLPSVDHHAVRLGPVHVPTPVVPTIPRQPPVAPQSTGHTFASVQQAPMKRKPSSTPSLPTPSVPVDESSEEGEVSEDVDTSQETLAAAAAFPPEVMADSSRRQMLSLLLRTLRGHLTDRLSKRARKRHKTDDKSVVEAQRDAGPPAEPVSAQTLAQIAVAIEQALFGADGACSEVSAIVIVIVTVAYIY